MRMRANNCILHYDNLNSVAVLRVRQYWEYSVLGFWYCPPSGRPILPASNGISPSMAFPVMQYIVCQYIPPPLFIKDSVSKCRGAKCDVYSQYNNVELFTTSIVFPIQIIYSVQVWLTC